MVAKPIKGGFRIRNVGFHCSGITVSLHKNIHATNIDISDEPPVKYVSRYKEKLGEDAYKLACEQNALPENFENMEYMEFIEQRRILMSKTIKKAYDELCK